MIEADDELPSHAYCNRLVTELKSGSAVSDWKTLKLNQIRLVFSGGHFKP
jgi:hypothetical protein